MLWEQITFRDESDIRLSKPLADHFITQSQKLVKEKTQIIISQADETDDVFYIFKGSVKVSTLAPNSKEYIFREIGAGNLIGELSALDGDKRSVIVSANEDTILYKMNASSFKNLISGNEDFSNYLTNSLVKRVRNLSEQVFELTTMNVRCRILLDLIRRAKNASIKDGTVEFKLPKDQTQIAIALATHREAISREYSAFAKKNLIKKENDKVIVYSIEKLENLLSKMMGL